ncbi:MAG: valine--tRNA ligase [Candidatus Aenigmarchaeota archaeon]
MEPKLTDKRWNKELEPKLYKKWEEEKLHEFDPKRPGKIFAIDNPPPYPSGRPWHIGAAAHYSQIDMIARTARMMGRNVLFPLGIDRNGLPVEIYTEKKHKVRLIDMTREKFMELCRGSLDELEAEMIDIMKSMGMSFDSKNHYYRTDSEEYRAVTQATFIELWKKGTIYEDTRPNNYCLDCGTTIADAEIGYKELPTYLVNVRFKVKETGKELIIATTRPELLCSCQVVMVNPDDDRYKALVGKHAVTPLYNKEVKIISHPYVDPEFGSGIVMMCSYGDYNDVRIFRELGLQEIIAMGIDGKMTKAAGPYAGMKIYDARKKVIADLEKASLVEKKAKLNHRTPLCERSNTPIQIIPMKEFYLRQLDVKEKVREMSKKIKFHPEKHRQILENWIDSVTIDWPISRRRYYATEIPIWYCKACGKPCLPEPGPYYRPWKDKPPFSKCEHCGETKGFVGETRTFDTWMDSSISAMFVAGYKRDDTLFKKAYPTAIRPQAKDIVRTWLYYTILRCYQLTGKPPFEHAWIMGYGVDEKGEKMSKSEGNVLDPIPMLEKYGADIFRFWNTFEASLGNDIRCSESYFEPAAKFLTKLWNVCRFISSFPMPKKKPALLPLDEWILSELLSVVEKSLKGYEDFNFFIPATEGRDFVWNVFAPHYLEMAKARAYGTDATKEEQDAALWTLYHCLRTVLEIMAPVIPFITDHVYRELYDKKGVHVLTFPKPGKHAKPKFTTEALIELNSQVWKAKKDKGLSLRAELFGLSVPKKFQPIGDDLKRAHNAEVLKYAEKVTVSF